MRNLKIFLMAILVILTISCATTRQEQKAAVSARASEDFLKAAASEDINEVRKLIEAGVDVNAADEWGVTALMVAAFKGDSEIVRLLIDHRADVDRTCIHINAVTHALVKAAFKDLGPSAKTIFVPPEYPNPTTALMVTAYYGHAEVARLLIDAGAQVDAANSAGTTALMLAAESGHADCARLLIDAGAQVDAANSAGNTALLLAAWRGHTEYARLLIEAGADIDFTPMSNGDTPLYVAALCGHPEIVRMFVTAGANVNARSTDGNTALMAAAHCGNIKIVQLLIEAGTDINAFNAKGQTAMVLASDSGYNEVVRMLKQVGANE